MGERVLLQESNMKSLKFKVKSSKLIWFGSIILLFISSGCALPWQKQVPQSSEQAAQEEAKQMVTLKITDNDGKTYDYPIEYKEGLTAFDLFTWAGVQVTTKQYDFGVYVEAVQGIKGEKGYFWIYYVNGTPAMQAADKYIVQPNDVIEWKYEVEKAGL
jgi:hypothetical protein